MRPHLFACVLVAACVSAVTVSAQQLTTGSVSGRIQDVQGGVIPGATVELISETRGTAAPAVATNERGEFLVPNLAPGTYRMEVKLEGFKTIARTGIEVSGGDRLVMNALVLEVGNVAETVSVVADVPIIQSQSGERSFTIPAEVVQSLPIENRSFTQLAGLAPGVTASLGGNVSAGIQPQRIGGGGMPVILMDGVGTMDAASNRPALQMNVESIGEVKVVTSSYQAEYGRSGGVQVLAVTKSGSNQFRGSLYDIERNSEWNAIRRTEKLNGDAKPYRRDRDWGYSIGGPIGKPGGTNRLFFFYAQEYAPRERAGEVTRFRVPTALERAGDFSQTRDNNGALYNLIRDASTGLPCTATNTAGCFRDGGVVGRIPANRLYQPGLNILRQWPLPNVDVPGAAFNFESVRPSEKLMAWQPAIRIDYNVTDALRASVKYSAWQQQSKVLLGSIPGYNDGQVAIPKVDTWATSVNYSVTSTTFLEATYGRTRQPQCCGSLATLGSAPLFLAGIPVNDAVLAAGLDQLPLIFPDALLLDPRYIATRFVRNVSTPLYQNGRFFSPPTFTWGNRIGNSPPNIGAPGGNATYNEDFVVSVTKLLGRHTLKSGFYYTHVVKYQAQAAGTVGSVGSARGALNFGNSVNNPLDSTFGFANAALGIFTSFRQNSTYSEGANGFRNIEGYVQDTWRFNDKLTLDYGLRLVHQQPQHDELGQGANFLPERWSLDEAPLLYVAGCVGGANPCTGNNRQAKDPRTGALLGPGSAAYIGAVVPGTGNELNGLVVPGQGISKNGVVSPKLKLAPRFGFAYDMSGRQTLVVRGGVGVFYTRGPGQFLVSNPPAMRDVQLINGRLQTLGEAATAPPTSGPAILAWQYESPYPASTQWTTGVQMMLPFSTALDVAYVGNHAWDDIDTINIGAIDIGTAFLPENQDPTLAPNVTPGANAIADGLLRPFRGISTVNITTNGFSQTFHGLQFSVNRRMRNGLQFGFNDNVNLYYHKVCVSGGNCVGTSLAGLYVPRFVHNPDGSFSYREDNDRAIALFSNARPTRHQLKANAIWDLPNRSGNGVFAWIVNDWQLAGVWTGQTGSDYTVSYTYSNGGTNINLTGSPDYPARVRIVGDPGAGCSSDSLRQFNTSAFQGPVPPSDGLESGNGYLKGCFQSVFDLSFSRTFRFSRGRTIQVRADIYNAFNQAIVSARNTTMQLTSPNDPVTITNLPFDAAGNVIAARSVPSGAGFGVATEYQEPRTVQLQFRLTF